jgi:uncharacterized protein
MIANPAAALETAAPIGAVAADRRFGFARTLFRLPAHVLLLLIRVYQRTLSPALPVITLGQCVCRFTPSCSHYAADAIRTHGAIAGMLLAVKRLAKCTPLHSGGFDPVPPRNVKPRCLRVKV